VIRWALAATCVVLAAHHGVKAAQQPANRQQEELRAVGQLPGDRDKLEEDILLQHVTNRLSQAEGITPKLTKLIKEIVYEAVKLNGSKSPVESGASPELDSNTAQTASSLAEANDGDALCAKARAKVEKLCPTTKITATAVPNGGNAVEAKWDGAYNSTHADETPRDQDGTIQDKKWFQEHCNFKSCNYQGDYSPVRGCLTQVTVEMQGAEKRNSDTCTSCKEGFAFAMRYHKSRAGMCLPYQAISRLTTGELGVDRYSSGVQTKNLVSTKVLLSRNLMRLDKLEGKAKKHFRAENKAMMEATWGKGKIMAIADCEVRKETVCRSSACQVRKQAKCVQVCKMVQDGAYKRVPRIVYRAKKLVEKGKSKTLMGKKLKQTAEEKLQKAKAMRSKEKTRKAERMLQKGKRVIRSGSNIEKRGEITKTKGQILTNGGSEKSPQCVVGLESEQCFPELCQGVYGDLACTDAARME